MSAPTILPNGATIDQQFKGTGRQIPALQVWEFWLFASISSDFFTLDTMSTIKHTLGLHEVTKMHTSVVSMGITSGIGRTIFGMTHKSSSKYQVKTTVKKAVGDSSLKPSYLFCI